MKRAIGLAVALAVGMLLLPTIAVGKTTTLKGDVKGDRNAKVTVKVKTTAKGFPLTLKSFEFKRVDSECDGEVSGVVKNTDVDPNLHFVGFNNEGKESNAYQVRGDIHRKSKKITNGEIELFLTDEAGDLETNCGEVKFSASR
jgi:hypothetical protein